MFCRPATLLACALSAACAAAWAEPASRDGVWRGLAGASLSMSSGNTESAALLVNVNVARQVEGAKTSLQAFVNQAQSKVDGDRNTTANKWGLSGQQDEDLTPEWFAFVKLGVDADRLIELKRRTNVAAGLGYHVIDSEAHTFDVFGGVSYTDKLYRRAQTIRGETDTRFTNTGLLFGEESSHRLSDTVSLKQRLEYFPSFTGDRTQLVRFNGSLNVGLSKSTSLSVGLISTYNSKVPPGVKKTDTSLFTGLNVKLGG